VSHSPVRSLPVIIYYYCANQPAGRSFHFPNVVNRQTERNPSGKQRLPVTVGRHAKITAYHPTNVAATCVYKTCVYVFRPKDFISRYIVVVSNYAVARRSAAIRRRHYRAVEDNGVVPPPIVVVRVFRFRYGTAPTECPSGVRAIIGRVPSPNVYYQRLNTADGVLGPEFRGGGS